MHKGQKTPDRLKRYFACQSNDIIGYYHGCQNAVWKTVSICEESVNTFTVSSVLLVLRMGRGMLCPKG